jgi:hypothetical protein
MAATSGKSRALAALTNESKFGVPGIRTKQRAGCYEGRMIAHDKIFVFDAHRRDGWLSP